MTKNKSLKIICMKVFKKGIIKALRYKLHQYLLMKIYTQVPNLEGLIIPLFLINKISSLIQKFKKISTLANSTHMSTMNIIR